MGEIDCATREVRDGARLAAEQRDARERQARPWRMTDWGVVAVKPGNSGRAKAPCFRANAGKRQGSDIAACFGHQYGLERSAREYDGLLAGGSFCRDFAVRRENVAAALRTNRA
jgi:hypothetical protein